jgi:hypothetical protein
MSNANVIYDQMTKKKKDFECQTRGAGKGKSDEYSDTFYFKF